MGKKYIPVAKKKLCAAANSKNLEFLTNAAQEEEISPPAGTEAENERGRNMPRRKNQPKSLNKPTISNKNLPSPLHDSLGLRRTSPAKRVLDIQTKFCQDWEELIECSQAGPSNPRTSISAEKITPNPKTKRTSSKKQSSAIQLPRISSSPNSQQKQIPVTKKSCHSKPSHSKPKGISVAIESCTVSKSPSSPNKESKGTSDMKKPFAGPIPNIPNSVNLKPKRTTVKKKSLAVQISKIASSANEIKETSVPMKPSAVPVPNSSSFLKPKPKGISVTRNPSAFPVPNIKGTSGTKNSCAVPVPKIPNASDFEYNEESILDVGPVTYETLNVPTEFCEDWEELEPADKSDSESSTLSDKAIEDFPFSIKETVELKGTNTKRTYGVKQTPKGQELQFLLDESDDDETRGTKPEISECRCGQQSNIEKLKKENETLRTQLRKLKKLYNEATLRTIKLSDTLSSSIMGQARQETFTEVEGFPNKEQLVAFSNQGIKSDYIFVKLVMEELWPTGFINRSVTGRPSNNPRGRPAVGGKKSGPTMPVIPRVPLEKDKIDYIKARLLEHRLFRGDTPAVAKIAADEATNLMKRVLAYYGRRREERS